MARWVAWIVMGLLSLALVGAYILNTFPISSGEYRTSPNSQYCARALTIYQKRLFRSARRYYVYEIAHNVCEGNDGPVVWHAEYTPGSEDLLDYGMRDTRFVRWAATNDEVAFTLDDGRILTIPAPK